MVWVVTEFATINLLHLSLTLVGDGQLQLLLLFLQLLDGFRLLGNGELQLCQFLIQLNNNLSWLQNIYLSLVKNDCSTT